MFPKMKFLSDSNFSSHLTNSDKIPRTPESLFTDIFEFDIASSGIILIFGNFFSCANSANPSNVAKSFTTRPFSQSEPTASNGLSYCLSHVKSSKTRSEERRVGKECRSQWWAEHEKKIV